MPLQFKFGAKQFSGHSSVLTGFLLLIKKADWSLADLKLQQLVVQILAIHDMASIM